MVKCLYKNNSLKILLVTFINFFDNIKFIKSVLSIFPPLFSIKIYFTGVPNVLFTQRSRVLNRKKLKGWWDMFHCFSNFVCRLRTNNLINGEDMPNQQSRVLIVNFARSDLNFFCGKETDNISCFEIWSVFLPKITEV